MPINISNRLDIGALQALAGQDSGKMNLPTPVGVQPGLFGTNQVAAQNLADTHQDVQKKIQADYLIEQLKQRGLSEAAAIDAVLKFQMEQFKQQGEMNKEVYSQSQQNRRADQTNLLGYNQLSSADQYRQGQLGVAQSQLGINQQQADQTAKYQGALVSQADQRIQLEQHVASINEILKMKQDARDELGSVTAGYLYRASRSQDPKQLESAQKFAISQLTGKVPEETIKQLSNMSPDEFKQYAAGTATVMSHANTIHDTLPTLAEQGGQLIAGTDAAGNPTMSIGLPHKAKDEAIKTVQEYAPIQNQLDTWIKSWAPVYDQYKGEAKGIVGTVEGKLGFGILRNPEYVKRFNEAKSNLAGMVVDLSSTLKNSRSPLIQEQLRKMMPEEHDSPEAVEGKQQALQTFINNHLNTAKQSVQLGTLPIDQRGPKPVAYEGENTTSTTSKTVPVAEIEQVMAAKNMTREQVEKTYNVKGE